MTKDMLVRKLGLSKLERISIPFYTEYGNSEEILPWLRYCSLSAGAMYALLSTFRRFFVVWAFDYKHINRIQWIENVHKSLWVCLYYFQVQTENWRQFFVCSKIAKLHISSHVPVHENMKNLLWLSDSNWSISPAAIWVLNNLFRYCIKLGPATMLFASCSNGLL